jgi:uncharacterized protein YlaI
MLQKRASVLKCRTHHTQLWLQAIQRPCNICHKVYALDLHQRTGKALQHAPLLMICPVTWARLAAVGCEQQHTSNSMTFSGLQQHKVPVA